MGRTATRELEAADFLNKEHDGAVDFAQAAAVNLVAGGQIEPITEREWKDQAEAVAFMQEPLTIHIHTSSDKNAPPAAMACAAAAFDAPGVRAGLAKIAFALRSSSYR